MTTVALAQLGSVAFDPQATTQKAVDAIAGASASGAELIIFPEAFLGTYPKGLTFGSPIGKRTEQGRDEYLRYWNGAVELDGPELAEIAGAARDHCVFVVIGVVERVNRTLYCTAVMIDGQGHRVGHHRKVMPTGAERLVWGFGDGSTLPVVPSPAGALGTVICWENYMPLLRSAMYSQGIEIYCAPTADDRDSWIPSMRHIALEGRCYVITTCQVMYRSDYPDDYDCVISTDPGEPLMRGGSAVISPTGEVIAGPVFDEECVIYAEVDREEIIRQSLDFDVSGHYGRPDIFSLHLDDSPKNPLVTAPKEAD
ncbi:carbon-nitrogen hydrolase family protein [Corynebacterium pacaense]|uniref:carbon-nitrogen hydrolase family protein n=1 Tax=Corynebacterium pacaense TaxID=1816684 RepID=UPI0009B9F9EC|nr:carbon-nitrogen hydrolase family protein [Corynebacterium pacaense]